MKSATVRDLRYNFKHIEELLAEGDEIKLTKRKRVIAHIVPVKPKTPKAPDFMTRLRKQFGDQVLKVSGAELIRQDRDRY